jgi:soluble lytic murein transglycosylase-like protein
VLGVALLVAGPVAVQAGGVPLSVWTTMKWVEGVLEHEAPTLDPDARAEVARTVAEECEARSLDPALVLAVIKVESHFRVAVTSPRGARGLMQVMPRVARELNGGTLEAGALEDPTTNIRLGTTLLRTLVNRYNGNLPHALAAYNLGPKGLRDIMAPYGRLHEKDSRYVRKVLAAAERIKATHPQRGGGEG